MKSKRASARKQGLHRRTPVMAALEMPEASSVSSSCHHLGQKPTAIPGQSRDTVNARTLKTELRQRVKRQATDRRKCSQRMCLTKDDCTK